jgi:tellurite resistance protein TerC
MEEKPDRVVGSARNGTLLATPLLLALVMVEFTDLVFAVDSIPAIFAVTTDPLVVYTSNAFAILGLRSLYFLLADAAARFRFLKVGLAVILLFVGAKLILADLFHLPPLLSLAVVLGILGASIGLSLRATPGEDGQHTSPASRIHPSAMG